ncbi:MAG: carboxypeptidase regulatory-like domain-containing protein [Acidobacteria bacterium]|nr:carboxypeptidase regulatory-like domain-containing protein [Acidobacteriota bacterium]
MLTSVLLLAVLLQAEPTRIHGRVVDAATGAPLPRVLITVKDAGSSTLTDDDGRFTLDLQRGRRTVFVSVVGYALTRREIDVAANALTLTIPLTEGTGTYAETVNVPADRFSPAEAGVAAQNLLRSAELQNLRGVLADDPLRAVQVLPGVVAGDDLRSEFSVRGSPFSSMNMTVEGFATPYVVHTVRSIEDYSGSGSVSMINSDILQDVALLSGGYPQRYGNRTGAEIDFRLREGSRDRTHARLAVSGTNASTVLEGPLGGRRGSWLVSARQSYLDLIVRQIDDGVQFGFTDTQAKVAFDVTPSQRVDVALIAGRSSLEERQDGEDGQDEVFMGRNGSAIAIAGWRLTRPGGVFNFRTMASLNGFSNTASDQVRIDEGHDKVAAARLDAVVSEGAGIHLEAGADVERTVERRARQRSIGGRYRTINDFDGTATKAGAYAQVRLNTPWLTVVPGVRADHSTLTEDTTVSPWLQAEVPLPAALTLRGGAGIYQQFPGFEQVIGALAASSTRPQRAAQFDVGIEQRLGATMRWQVTLYGREESAFFRRPDADTRLVNDRVVFGSRSARFSQTLDGFARGVEVLLQRKASTGLSGWASYAYGRNRYTDTSTNESFDGDFDQRHTLNLYGFFRKSERVSFSGKARVGSNVPAPGYYREADGLVYLSSRRNEVRLPVYSRVDFRANRTFNWSRRRMTMFVEIMNALNRDNVRFNPPGLNTQTRQVRNIYERMIPIIPSLGVLFEM